MDYYVTCKEKERYTCLDFLKKIKVPVHKTSSYAEDLVLITVTIASNDPDATIMEIRNKGYIVDPIMFGSY